MASRERPTAFDFAIMALSPALIMGLVGSLGLFLLDVLYRGQFEGRLQWTLCFFVFGIVLVGRIALMLDASRAGLYGMLLSGAVFLAMSKFLENVIGTLMNLVIIGVTWWAAHILVKDCTHLDENEEDAGQGLIRDVEDDLRYGSSTTQRSHTPGRWVVYFSLAALPIFGLGQAIIPSGDLDRRRYAFWLMTVYVGSGLGLLATTTLLTLRRYLRQKRLAMPASMSALWLILAGGLTLAFLIIGAVLPRPNAEYGAGSWLSTQQSKQKASRTAMSSDSPGQGDGDAKGQSQDSSKNDGSTKDGNGGQGQPGGKNATGSSKSVKSAGKSAPGGTKGSGSDVSSKGEPSKAGDSRSKTNANDPGKSPPMLNVTPTPASPLQGMFEVLRWIVLLALAIGTIVGLFWFLRGHWGELTEAKKEEPGPVIDSVEVVEPPRPFREFRNPFAAGMAEGQSPESLLRYTFAALESWAAEFDTARREDETPLEFARRLDETVPPVGQEAQRLVQHYVGVAYANRRPPESSRRDMARLWSALENRVDASTPD